METGAQNEQPAVPDRRRALSDADQRIVQEIVEEHIQVSCDLVVIDEHTWAIHGSIAVEGEILVAEFEDRDEAESTVEQIVAAEREPPAD
jgi:hypothetical protein